MSEAVKTYTDAPEVYDGFGTMTISKNQGKTRQGLVRCVETPSEHLDWQRMRYGSGNYLHASQDEWDEYFKDYANPIKPGLK